MGNRGVDPDPLLYRRSRQVLRQIRFLRRFRHDRLNRHDPTRTMQDHSQGGCGKL